MFAHIRNRLTMLYSGIMVLFLVTFIIVSYAGLIWVLYHEEQRDVQAITEEEAREHVLILKQPEVLPHSGGQEGYNNEGKIFYYVFGENGNQVFRAEPASDLRLNVRDIIQNWNERDGEARLKIFSLPSGESAFVMMCSKKIYDGDHFLGTVFVGEDLTAYYQMLKKLMVMLFAVAIVFLLIAAFIGHTLAGRAIIPIKQSFLRQREFAADASHELRTPLSVLMTSVDVVQTDDESNLSTFSSQVLADMKSEIKRMSKLVSDLLILARGDAGVTTMNKEKFNLYNVGEQVIRILQPAAIEKGIKLELSGINNINVYADKERMKQLLLILIDNAIKYTADGGTVILLLKMVNGLKQAVNITVQDNGAGIPKEQQQLIFERFYRIDKARSREEGGTGLGLSIAKWIAEAHGGAIRVESVPGIGSSFIVTFPM
ncbi:HAMP domain-containing sensor histidine kinase [Sporomusa sp.]|uniref:sensor histidine kinase n=1 Tax=Sporomusa sp. TaxID=2078658 RepID=UPI002BE4FA41|nr:HAMP domain-containing sensor histidine kinase [Sporomusa sp.]HWR41936.1 HAMP domain-containing sensor histidine kinase [Sporomusa sp.]